MKGLAKAPRLLLAVVAAALIASSVGAPANAGTLEWTDDKDDATDFLLAAGAAPNEPTLDIVKTTMASDDKNLTWEIHIAELAESPAIAPGYFFRFNFAYEGQGFAFRAGKDLIGENLQFRVSTDQIGFNLPCEECTVKYDLDASKVVLTVPIKSLIAGVAAADTDCTGCRDVPPPAPLPPLAKGAELTGLNINAQYYYVRTTPNADTSAAPDGSVFVL